LFLYGAQNAKRLLFLSSSLSDSTLYESW
jgi:hypothetical protein